MKPELIKTRRAAAHLGVLALLKKGIFESLKRKQAEINTKITVSMLENTSSMV